MQQLRHWNLIKNRVEMEHNQGMNKQPGACTAALQLKDVSEHFPTLILSIQNACPSASTYICPSKCICKQP